MTTLPTSSLLGRGARSAGRAWTILLTYYVTTFLFVLPLALLLRRGIAAHAGATPLIEQLLGSFRYTVYFDFANNYPDVVSIVNGSILPVAFVSLIVNALFGPGLIGALAGEGSAAEFLRQTGRFLGRASRLLLTFAVGLVLVLFVWSLLVGFVWMSLTAGDAIESDYLIALIICGILYALPIALVVLAAQYAQTLTVFEDRRSMLRAAWDGLVFVLRRPGAMMVLHGSVFVLLVVWVLLYWWIEGAIGMTSAGGILFVALLQQVVVAGRIYARMWNAGNALELVRHRARSVAEPSVASAAASIPFPGAVTPVIAPSSPVEAMPQKRRIVKRAPARRKVTARRPPRRGRKA